MEEVRKMWYVRTTQPDGSSVEDKWYFVRVNDGGVLIASDSSPDAAEKYYAPGTWSSAVLR